VHRAAHRSQRRRTRLGRLHGEGFGKVRQKYAQPKPGRDRKKERRVPAAIRRSSGDDKSADGRADAADVDPESRGVLELRARGELHQCIPKRRNDHEEPYRGDA
jgi:hypothetical protein